MKTIETNIPDVISENLNKAKLVLAEKIIRNVHPLLDELYSEKIVRVKELEEELKRKKGKVQEEKNTLEALMEKYRQTKKVKKLLERVSKLVSSGLVHSGLRNETVVLLKVVDNLPEDKLDFHLHQTMKIISKRFAKS